MELTPMMFLIACPLCCLAGMLNAISGGGGFIAIPAFLLAGLPPHFALGTDKLQSVCGMAVANFRFIKQGLVDWSVALIAIPTALIGAAIGTNLVLLVDEAVLMWLLMLVLPIVAYFTLSKRFSKNELAQAHAITAKSRALSALCAFAIGLYDGFYGPGSGTFLVIAFTLVAHMGVVRANAHSKVVNLATSLGALVIFLVNGKVLILLGLAAGACNMLGAWIGAGLVMKRGMVIVKPCIIIALVLLAVKVVVEQVASFAGLS